MYQDKDGNIVAAANTQMMEEKGFDYSDKTIEKITVKGSDSFVSLYLVKLRELVGERVVEVSIKYMDTETCAEVSVGCDLPNRSLLQMTLSALTKTLKSETVKMDDTVIIGCGKYSIYFESESLYAIRNGDLISYKLLYRFEEDDWEENKDLIELLKQKIHDTYQSSSFDNERIAYRNRSNSSEQLIENSIYDFLVSTDIALSFICEVQTIKCKVKAVGVEE